MPYIKAPKNGYCFAYISNESSINVFFDNFKVRHDRGRIIEENHYYAYGLKIAPLSSKAYGAPNNNYTYQGDYSEIDEDLGWHDFALRSYDPQTGRFLQSDPYEQFSSGYIGMGNDPVNVIDPSGGFGIGCAATMGLVGYGGAASNIGGSIMSGVNLVSNFLNVAVKTAGVIADYGISKGMTSQKICEYYINQALAKPPSPISGLGIGMLIVLVFTPDLDSWDKQRDHEFPTGQSPLEWYKVNHPPQPAPLPKYEPAPTKPPTKDPNKKSEKKYWQYVLVATDNEELYDPEYLHDIMTRGERLPTGRIKLSKDEVWKFGTTSRPERRYTQKWLDANKLKMIRQFDGTREEVRQKEAEKIRQYQLENGGKLPPGNKIIGNLFKKKRIKNYANFINV